MPLGPQDVARLVMSDGFQSLLPGQQHAQLQQTLRDAGNFEGVDNADEQHIITSNALNTYTPSKLASFAEAPFGVSMLGVPVVSDYIRGERANLQGEPLSPMAQGLANLTAPGHGELSVAGPEAGGYQPRSASEAGLLEAGKAVGIYGVTGGAAEAAEPLIAGGVSKMLGTSAATVADALATRPISEAVSQAAEGAAMKGAAKAAIGRHLTQFGTAWTAGAMVGAANSVERAMAGGDQDPVEDFLKTPLNVAIFGSMLFGVGEAARRFGINQLGPLAQQVMSQDPNAAGYAAQAPAVIDAVKRASAGKLTNEGAANLVFDAVTQPLSSQTDIHTIKDALKQNPEIIGSDLGLHLFRTQRDHVTAPDIKIIGGAVGAPDVYPTSGGPQGEALPISTQSRETASGGTGLRVTYDDEQGRTTTEILPDAQSQRAFGVRVSEGRVIVDNAAGDQASILRANIAKGTPLEPRRAPGAGAQVELTGPQDLSGLSSLPLDQHPSFGRVGGAQFLRPENEPPQTDFGSVTGQVPALIQQAEQVNGLMRQHIEIGRASDVASPTDYGTGVSPESGRRLGAERVRGVTYSAINVFRNTERPLPAMMSREDMKPASDEVIVKREPGVKPYIQDVGSRVSVQKRLDIIKNLQNEWRTAQPQRALPATPPERTYFATDASGELRQVSPPPIIEPPKEPGAMAATPGGARFPITSTADAAGRVTVDLGSGRSARVPWNYRDGTVDVPPQLFDLPERPTPPLEMTVRDQRTANRAAAANAAARTGARQASVSKAIDEQIQPGQLIHQTVQSVDTRGVVGHSIEVIARNGDQVTIRMGEATWTGPVADIAEGISRGNNKFAFDINHTPDERAEAAAEHFNKWVREQQRVEVAKPVDFETDRQLGRDLFTYDTEAGQNVAPAADARNVGDNAAKRAKAREERPADEKTKGGNSLVKGCK